MGSTATNDTETLRSLSVCFSLAYRSLGQYLRPSKPVFDVGIDIVELVDGQTANIQRLGEYLVDRRGSVETGFFPGAFGRHNFANFSSIVSTFLKNERELLERLVAERRRVNSDDPGVAILDDIIRMSRMTIEKLEHLTASSS